MAHEFVGRGFAFPMRVDSGGSMALVEDTREVEEAMALVLRTAPGERPMRPDFGCGIHEHVFSPADAATAGRIAWEVRRALERWEPRVEVVDVVVTPAPGTRDALLIDIHYQLSGTNDPRNLVFPFYVLPPEG
jgi:phage baseplate assembly protein W